MIFVVSENDYYAETIAMFDLCSVGIEFSRIFKEDAKYGIFEINGNETIKEDKYGNNIKVAETDIVIKTLDTMYKKTKYWRLKSASEMIKSIQKENDTRDNIKVYSYGY